MKSKRWNERGLAAIEYALIAALVAIAIIAALKSLGGAISTKLNDAATQIADS